MALWVPVRIRAFLQITKNMIAFISIVTLLAILYASYLRGEINSLEGKVADLKIKVDLLEKGTATSITSQQETGYTNPNWKRYL